MPLFICFCPDYPNNLQARLKVREEHLALGAKDRDAGKSGASADSFHTEYESVCLTLAVFGRAFTDPSSGGMAGSTMIYRYPSLEAAWERIKRDPYWTGGVWDKEKLEIRQLADGPSDETLELS